MAIDFDGEAIPSYPERVQVLGPGVEHGVLMTFRSVFVCDTRGAGGGELAVSIKGPKGEC